MKSGISKHLLWYTRRGAVIRGPFPPGQIRRYLLLGRIIATDEISTDQINWCQARDHEDVFPEELKADLSDPAARERLRLARVREDERIRDRRLEPRYEVSQEEEVPQRSGVDRRKIEDVLTLSSRQQRRRIALHDAPVKQRTRILALGVTGIFICVLLISILLTPESEPFGFQCLQSPVPGVNWSNCKKTTMALRGLDLRRAQMNSTHFDDSDLSNTDFSYSAMEYADFTRVTMAHARFEHVQLKGAVFRSTSLRDTSMQSAQLTYASFQDATLSNVNLENADLSNADFKGAVLSEVNFNGAKLVNAIWIDGRHCGAKSIGMCVPVP